ncbi:hypothetical protein TI39_contig4419g00002 [Zymoseptoria brevis]|uniref:Uncharacterized protein n=1 Tax=Zymoseptoria brevis TaxID=1047168 RepID=A0A0F4G6T7_9PEZI|nr:hypothetical protein TI39_contig4419g00002 [Zymoseptoria brevis]
MEESTPRRAVENMLSLFRQVPECNSVHAIHRWFAKPKPNDSEHGVGELMQWSDEMIAEVAGENEGLTFTASNAEDLCSQLERYTTCMEYDVISSLATLVGGVRLHNNDPLIDIGVSFMEAPQSDDFSLLPSYHFDGITHGIIVEDCRRATDNSTLAINVAKVQPLGDDRAILALTNWDQIGMINERDMDSATDIQRETASNLAEKSADLEQQMAVLQIEREELDPFSEVQRFEELDLRWEELEILTRHAFNAEKAHRIHVLGEQAGQHLLRRELRGCHRAPIFSISNLDYAAHLKAYRLRGNTGCICGDHEHPQPTKTDGISSKQITNPWRADVVGDYHTVNPRSIGSFLREQPAPRRG